MRTATQLTSLVLLFVLTGRASGQARSPVGIDLAKTRSIHVAAPSILTADIGHAVQDTAATRPSARPYVLTGAVLGALAGLLLYREGVERTQDGDFAFPFSLVLPVSLGAAIGAYVGFIPRPM